MPSRIEDYALIGDCETAALVSKDGSIDWLCWPRFDSAACFAALLGNADNGRWQIAPAAVERKADVRIERQYRRNTLILETEFTAADGSAAVLIDFMPVRQGRAESRLIRLVVGKSGTVAMRAELIVRFGYGGWTPWVTRSENGDLLAIAGPDMLHLRTPVELRGERMTTVSDFACRPDSEYRSSSPISHRTYQFPSRRMQKRRCNRRRHSGSRGQTRSAARDRMPSSSRAR
jgi:GH15 family glucan-1,4-alpha-glucosidase